MDPYFRDDKITLWHGHSLTVLRSDELGYDYRLGYAPPAIPDGSVDCVVTSPPYFGLRDYGQDGQYGLEQTPAAYVEAMRELFAEVRRILADTGTLWLNLGDSYSGSGKGAWSNDATRDENKARVKESYVPTRAESPLAGATFDGLPAKNLIGIPWRVAFALQDDGWILRNDIIWSKPNGMPESVLDRLGAKHEYVFMFAKSSRYYFDLDAIRVPLNRPDVSPNKVGGNNPLVSLSDARGGTYAPDSDRGRNPGDVWAINTKPFAEAHFAVMPLELARRCIKAGGPKAGKRCDCDDVIRTPLGEADENYVDYTQQIGRAGLGRSRRPNEGVRPITKREQRGHAEQLRLSPHRPKIESMCGDAFAHYVRTDDSGARALPPTILADLLAKGWLTEVPPCDHPEQPAGVVFDPFSGSGTTGLAAMQLGLRYVGIDLSADYLDLSLRTRFAQDTLDFEGSLA